MPSAASIPQICIIKAGIRFPENLAETGDFDDWLIAGLGLPRNEERVIDAREAAKLPAPSECAGVVISGAHAMITDDLPWMQRLSDWTRRLVTAQVPFLGICFGHPLLARAMGGQVGLHPQGRESTGESTGRNQLGPSNQLGHPVFPTVWLGRAFDSSGGESQTGNGRIDGVPGY
jgi:GMP synthase-like glutamine amidotransferase